MQDTRLFDIDSKHATATWQPEKGSAGLEPRRRQLSGSCVVERPSQHAVPGRPTGK
jgi:hypothetical protein